MSYAGLEKHQVKFPFAGGIDQSASERLVPLPAVRDARNLEMLTDGRYAPRYGFTSLSTSAVGWFPTGFQYWSYALYGNARRLGWVDGRPTIFTDNQYYEQTDNGTLFRSFYDSLKGKTEVVHSETGGFEQYQPNFNGMDSASNGTVVITAALICIESPLQWRVHFEIRDEATGELLRRWERLDNGSNNWNHVRICYSGGDFYVFAVDQASNQIYGWRIEDTTYTSITMNGGGSMGAVVYTFDICPSPSPNQVILIIGHGVGVGVIGTAIYDNTGAQLYYQAIAKTGGADVAAHVCCDAFGSYVSFAWGEGVPGTTGWNVYHVRAVAADLTGAVQTTLQAPAVWSGSRDLDCIATLCTSDGYLTGNAITWWMAIPALADRGGGAYNARCCTWRHVTPGTGADQIRYMAGEIAGRPFRHNDGDSYMHMTRGHNNIDRDTGTTYEIPDTLCCMMFERIHDDGLLCSPVLVGAYQIGEALGRGNQTLAVGPSAVSTGNYHARMVSSGASGRLWGCFAVASDQNYVTWHTGRWRMDHHLMSFRPSEADQITSKLLDEMTMVSGGAPMFDDGDHLGEIFIDRPHHHHIAKYNASGSPPTDPLQNDGTTLYVRAIYTAKLANGAKVRSAPSVAVPLAGFNDGTGDDLALVVYDAMHTTARVLAHEEVEAVYVELYRTSKAEPDIFRFTNAAQVFAPSGASSGVKVELILTGTDARHALREPLYTHSEYENTGIPSCSVMCKARNRIWARSDENQSRIYYSKVLRQEIAPEFNVDLAYIETGADIVAMEEMDGRLYLFGKTEVFYVDGEGPDNNGGGGEFAVRGVEAPGSSSHHAVATPGGILYFDGQRFCMLGRSMADTSVGRAVQEWTVGDGAESIIHYMVADYQKRCARVGITFASSEETCELCYYWELKRWTRNDVSYEGNLVDATVGDGSGFWMIGSDVGANVWKEDQDVRGGYDPNATAWTALLHTAWMRGDGAPASLKRFWRATFLVEASGTDGVSMIDAYYDDDDTLTTSHAFSAATNAEGALSIHLKHQKSRSVAFKVSIPNTASETVKLNGMNLEFGMVRGSDTRGRENAVGGGGG